LTLINPRSPTVHPFDVPTPPTRREANSPSLNRRFKMDYRVRAGEIPEDQTTALMESYSAKLPTSFFLGAAITSILGSLLLKTNGKDHHALFVGQWAAPFLLLGIYNKMVKQHGSDAQQRDSAAAA
jgi:hypothetical protein